MHSWTSIRSAVVDFHIGTAWHQQANTRSEVVQRLLAGRCELCGIEGEPVRVHHIRKLADIDRPGRPPKADWERTMSARRRKTLVVCADCHRIIHAGRHNGPAL
jgi:predicted HNH restriction endonuclease